MNSKLWIRKALSMCLIVATIATFSMVALAGSQKVIGELLVSGKNVDGETPSVKINGESSQTGRSVFSSSIIATPENAGAVINLGKVGKVELAPNTTLTLSFDERAISGDLIAGRLTVLNAAEAVSVKTVDGKMVTLNAGESAVSGKVQDDDNTTASGGGSAGIIFAVILAVAVGAIVIAARSDNNNPTIGGGTTVISPTR